MQDQVSKLIGTRVVVLNCLGVPFMDLSGLFALSELIDRLKHEEIKPILIVRDEAALRRQVRNLGYAEMLGDGIYHDYEAGLRAAWHHLDSAEALELAEASIRT